MLYDVFLVLNLAALAFGNGCPQGTLEDDVNKKCYFVSNAGLTWFDARDDCSFRGGELSKIENQAEQDFINTITNNSQHYWIGARNISAEVLWTDNSTVVWFDFNSVYEQNGDCFALSNSSWVSNNCTTTNTYMCQINYLPKCPDLTPGSLMTVVNSSVSVYVNETATIQCDTGYIFEETGSTSQQLVCRMNQTTGSGEYNETIGVCKEVNCTTLPTFSSMIAYYNSTSYNSSLVLKCTSGNVRSPSRLVTLTCNATGNWEQDAEEDTELFECASLISYAGCFKNGSLTEMTINVTNEDECYDFCRDHESAYYGLNNDLCYCGNMRDSSRKLPNNMDCSLACPYKEDRMCGGQDGQLTVYSVLEGCRKFDENELLSETWIFQADGNKIKTCREVCRAKDEFKYAILLVSGYCVCANRTNMTKSSPTFECDDEKTSKEFPAELNVTGRAYTLGSYELVADGNCLSLYEKGIRYQAVYYVSQEQKKQCNFYDGTVCEHGWIGSEGNCYHFGELLDFKASYKYCRDRDAHMVTILTESEHWFISDTVKTSDDYPVKYQFHIGLYDNWKYGSFQWHDGSIFAFSKFAPNQPSNAGQCGHLICGDSAYWTDFNCNQKSYTICKKNPDLYYGCIEVLASDLGPHLSMSHDVMSFAMCYQRCQANSMTYSAVVGTDCYCMNELPAHTNLSWTSCNQPCPGHHYQSCGGISPDSDNKIVFVTGGGTAGMFAESCTELELMGLTNDTFKISNGGQIESVECIPQGGVICPLSWISIHGRCFKFNVAHRSIPSDACIELGGYLAHVQDDDEIDLLQRVINNATYLRGPVHWIVGLFDMNMHGAYRWANGKYVNLSSLSVVDWGVESNCYGFTQNISTTFLLERPCDKTSFICSKEEDYLGCYEAPTSSPVLDGYQDNSIQQCVEICRGIGRVYAMMQRSRCWCEDSLTNSSDPQYCMKLCFHPLGQSCPSIDTNFVAVYSIAAYTPQAMTCEDLFNQGVMVPGTYVINSISTWCSFVDNHTYCSSAPNGSWVGVGKDGVCFVLDFQKQQQLDACNITGVLASIHNQQELDLLKQILWNSRSYSEENVYYIGGFDGFNQSLFSWADGSLMNFHHWYNETFHIGQGPAIVLDTLDNDFQLFNGMGDKRRLYVCQEVTDYQGCYLKNSSMIPVLADYYSMSLTLCKQLCLGERKKLALIHPTNCYCVDDLSSLTSASDSQCSMKCPGNILQSCGGETTVRAYTLDYDDIGENCSDLYSNGVLFDATYLLRNASTGANYTTRCGFSKNVSCSPGWIGYRGICLLVVVEEASLPDAMEVCASRGSVLYMPDTNESISALTNLLTQVLPWSHLIEWHVGMTSVMRNGLFQTADGRLVDPRERMESYEMPCLFMDVVSGMFHSQQCQLSETLPYVCVTSQAYIGCKNVSTSPMFTTSLTSMSVGQCVEYCRGHNTSQAGVVSSTCSCFNDVTVTLPDGHCNNSCIDAVLQPCGSPDRQFMSLYSTGTAVSGPTSCDEMFMYGVTIPGTYVIYPMSDPFYTECFIHGRQYVAILGNSVGILSASSERDLYPAENGRIGFEYISGDVWKPDVDDVDPWIQTELDSDFIITAVIVQGGRTISEWITSFTLDFSIDGERWDTYPTQLPGNTDCTTPVVNFLVQPFVAMFVRLVPVIDTSVDAVALRFELYGQKYELFDHGDRYVGCFAYFNISDFDLVNNLTTVDQCREQCQSTYPFYVIVKQNATSKCGCALVSWTYGRLNDSVCSAVSHIGSMPCGSENLHSVAVFRTYDKHCPDLDSVANTTSIITERHNASNAVMKYGSIIKYTCTAGHEVSDSGNTEQETTCLQNNTWSNHAQPCQIKYCAEPEPISNGTMMYTAMHYGSNVTYQCDAGFEISLGIYSLISQCLDTKEWSEISPECKRRQCDIPPDVENTVRDTNSTYRYLDTLVYSCVPSSAFSDNSTQKTSLCTVDGNWTHINDSCIYFECPGPPHVANAEVTLTSYDEAVYKCLTGYEFSDSSKSIQSVCGQDYIWSAFTAHCVLTANVKRRNSQVCVGAVGKKAIGDFEIVTARSKFDCGVICLSHVTCVSYNFRADSADANCELLVETLNTYEYAKEIHWNSYHLKHTCD